jgi:hypothetical protein
VLAGDNCIFVCVHVVLIYGEVAVFEYTLLFEPLCLRFCVCLNLWNGQEVVSNS